MNAFKIVQGDVRQGRTGQPDGLQQLQAAIDTSY